MDKKKIVCCDDCVHLEVCAMCVPALPICDSFLDRSRFVEIPCKLGDIVYCIEMCHTAEDYGKKYVAWDKARAVVFNIHNELRLMTCNSPFAHLFGKTVFLTREEAEAKLKEMER